MTEYMFCRSKRCVASDHRCTFSYCQLATCSHLAGTQSYDFTAISTYLQQIYALDQTQEVQAPAAAQAFQQSLGVVMDSYLNMIPKSAPAAFEQPKGFGSIFVKTVCMPLPAWIDTYQFFKLAVVGAVHLSYVLVHGSWLFVPLWLWFLRRQLQSASTLFSLSLLLSVAIPILLFITSEFIMSHDSAKRMSSRQNIVTAATLSQKPSRANTTNHYQTATATSSRAAGNTASQYAYKPVTYEGSTAANRDNNVPATGTSNITPAAQNNGSATDKKAGVANTTEATGTGRTSSPEWQAVRQAIIKLEFDLYGNELTEGVLPQQSLAPTLQRLCSDVGVAYPEGQLSPSDMLALLADVRKQAGFED